MNGGLGSKKFAACILLISEKNNLLCVSRRRCPRDIGLPGGKTDPGESALTSALREMFEETGIQLTADSVEEVFCQFDGEYETTTFLSFTKDKEDFLLALANFRSEAEKGIDVRWVTWAELLDKSNTFHVYNSALFKKVLPVLRHHAGI